MLSPRFFALVGMIAFAAVARLIPHPWNFTPVASMALFGGAMFGNKKYAFLIPLTALILSDIFLGGYPDLPFVYAAFCLIVFIGTRLHDNRRLLPITGGVLVSSFLFFVITNFGVWAVAGLYPRTGAGLATCYLKAIPFFRHTLLSDVFFSGLLFGSFHLGERWFPALRPVPQTF